MRKTSKMKYLLLMALLGTASLVACAKDAASDALNKTLLTEMEAEPFWTVPVPEGVTAGDLSVTGGNYSVNYPAPNVATRTWTGDSEGLNVVRSEVESSMRKTGWTLFSVLCITKRSIREFSKDYATPRVVPASATNGIDFSNEANSARFTVYVSAPSVRATGPTMPPLPPPTSIADHDCAP